MQRFVATANEHTRLIYLTEGTPMENHGQTREMQHSAANAALIKTQLRDGFEWILAQWYYYFILLGVNINS